MSFTLRWKNPNAIATVVNIYRDSKDISPSALPAPIATLTNGETEWRDTTAAPGQTYHYLATVTANGKTVATACQKYTIAVKRGIGPMTFIHGDDQLGFLGVVPYDEQWQPSQMPSGFLSIFPNLLTDRVGLYKFSRNGKILYLMSTYQQFPGISNWASLYQSGLVYGTNDYGPEGGHTTLPDTKQDARIIHNGDTYIMRLPRGLTEDDQPAAFPFVDNYHLKEHDAVSELTGYNEFNDLLYAMVVDVPQKQRNANWYQLATTYLGQGNLPGYAQGVNGGTLCQEHDTVQNRILQRGYFSTSTVAGVSAMQRILYTGQAAQGRYFPIFELVE